MGHSSDYHVDLGKPATLGMLPLEALGSASAAPEHMASALWE
jgi:hypothetical protein